MSCSVYQSHTYHLPKRVTNRMEEEDRLSSLPDELIHRILSCFDMKFAVQSCLLSSRWKLLWTSMPYINFSISGYRDLSTFSKFVSHVLYRRNHQVRASLVKLDFQGAADEDFLRNIAKYAFSHNVQELSVVNWPIALAPHVYPSCLFSSQLLKHFTFTASSCLSHSVTPTTPWYFPCLTSLHLDGLRLCGDIFSDCVNLKKLTLKHFVVENVEAFEIITPTISNLMLIDGRCSKVIIKIIAPQLENLTIHDCSFKRLKAPPELLCLCYSGFYPLPLFKDQFLSLNKVTICLSTYLLNMPYEEEYARDTLYMLQELHSARYLTLNPNLVECISSFPDLLSNRHSPFRNLICLAIDSRMEKFAQKVKMSPEARNFLLGNSSNATFIMDDKKRIKNREN